MAIPRLLFALVGAIAQGYSLTPPNNQPPTEQLREQRGAEPSMSLIVLSIKMLIWTCAFLEGSVLFALSGYCPPTLSKPLLHALFPAGLTSELTALTPAFLAGTSFTIAGTLLRAHCFRALGPHFTFHLSIRPAHVLMTDGVYGLVRHPSYTGFVATGVGYLLCVLDRQGPVVSMIQAHVSSKGGGDLMVTGVLACLWAAGLLALHAILYGRMNREDAMLEDKFGDEWRAWAKRVPYRLVPSVY